MLKLEISGLETITSTRAKVLFGEILHKTSVEGKKFAVNRHGKPVAVVLSYKEYSELVRKMNKYEEKLKNLSLPL